MEPPINVIVGRARLFEHAEMKPEAPSNAWGHEGQHLTVKLPYRFDHARPEWEGFQILLHASLDGGPERTAKLEDHVHRFRPSARRGVLMLRYDDLPAGAHRLDFRAEARYMHGPHGRPHEDLLEGVIEQGHVDLQIGVPGLPAAIADALPLT